MSSFNVKGYPFGWGSPEKRRSTFGPGRPKYYQKSIIHDNNTKDSMSNFRTLCPISEDRHPVVEIILLEFYNLNWI